MTPVQLGHSIKQTRKNAGKSIGWLAEQTGLSVIYVGKIEKGEALSSDSPVEMFQFDLAIKKILKALKSS